MKKILIIGNDIHALRYRDVLLFRHDCEIYFNEIKLNINDYDCIIFSEPYRFNECYSLLLGEYKNILLLEKSQFDFISVEKLKCKVYYVHLRDFDSNNFDINLEVNNYVKWPNLSNQGMDKIYHTLPNILDFLFNFFDGDRTIDLLGCSKEKKSIKIKVNVCQKNFLINIYDVEVFGELPQINGVDIQWPNYFKCINQVH